MRKIKRTILTDVLVIGFGNAGGTAALAAAQEGAKVLLIEKTSLGGGTSVCVPGKICVPTSMEYVDYLDALGYGLTKRNILESFCRQAMKIPEQIQMLGGEVVPVDSPFVFPQKNSELMRMIKVDKSEVRHSSAVNLYSLIKENVILQSNSIDVLYDTTAVELTRNENGKIAGAIIRDVSKKQLIEIVVTMGVILACGGFSANAAMVSDSTLNMPVNNLGSPGSTGDGIIMAARVGAAISKLTMMNSMHFSFKAPDMPFAAPIRFPEAPLCIVDQKGKRFLNEEKDMGFSSGYTPLRHFDFREMTFDRNPCYAIFDSRVINQGPISQYGYYQLVNHWSNNNQAEIEKGWIIQTDNYEQLAEKIGCDPDILGETMESFEGIYGILNAPLYAVELTAGIITTAGGPKRDKNGHVLDWYGNLISGLYAAGECGSVLGFLHQEGTYHTESLASGVIAGKNVVKDSE